MLLLASLLLNSLSYIKIVMLLFLRFRTLYFKIENLFGAQFEENANVHAESFVEIQI